jgi:cysteinyl-tRNA synthetase
MNDIIFIIFAFKHYHQLSREEEEEEERRTTKERKKNHEEYILYPITQILLLLYIN